MSFPNEANCRGLAPYDLPYPTLKQQWAIQHQWVPSTFHWRLNGTRPAWYASAAGLPGLTADLMHVTQATFDTQLEAHQLAFLNYDLDYTVQPELAKQLAQLQGLLDSSAPKDIILGIYGVFSLGLSITDEQETPIWYNPIMRDVLIEHIRLRCAWLEKTIGKSHVAPIIYFFEPFWNATNSQFIEIDQRMLLNILEEITQSIQTPFGLAPSGVVIWQPILESRLQYVVCEPTQQQSLLSCGQHLNTYFERGSTISWALVPATATELDQTNPEQLVETWDQLLKQGLAQDVLTSRMLSGSFITVANGLGSQPRDVAERAMNCLNQVVQLIRARYKLA